jgi:hypothetical protein
MGTIGHLDRYSERDDNHGILVLWLLYQFKHFSISWRCLNF